MRNLTRRDGTRTEEHGAVDFSSILTTLKAQEAELAVLRAEVEGLRAVHARHRRWLSGPIVRALVVACLFVLLLSSSASASVPDDAGTFHACYRSGSNLSQLYLLDIAKQSACPSGLAMTSWGQSPLFCPACTNAQIQANVAALGLSHLAGAYWPAADLSNAALDGATLTSATMSNAFLIHASLHGADLHDANLSDAYLYNANLQDANLRGAHLNFANLSSANLSGANVTDADLDGAPGGITATVTAVIWDNTTCPDGTNSDSNDGTTCVGHGF